MAEIQTFLNAAQTAEMLGLSTATIRKWVLSGFIPYKKIGRAVRFSAAEIRDWAMSKNAAPPEGRGNATVQTELTEGKNDGNY